MRISHTHSGLQAKDFKSHDSSKTDTTSKNIEEIRDYLKSQTEGLMRNNKPKPITISVCMIVRDEEENLKELLPQLTFADEIIVVDTDPNYNPNEIGRAEWQTEETKNGNRVKGYYFPWTDNFSEARNFAKSHCTKDVILWLDADDRLPEKTQKTLRYELDQGRQSTKETVHYLNVIMTRDGGKPIGLNVSQPRIFPNIPEIKWEGKVHETIGNSVIGIPRAITDIEIHHTGYEDQELLKKKNERNLKLLLESEPSPQVHMDLGNAYHARGVFTGDKGFFTKAIEEFKKAITFPVPVNKPFNDHISYLIGQSYIMIDEHDRALKSFKESETVDSLYGEADCYVNLNQDEKALHKYIDFLFAERKHVFYGSDSYNLRNNAYKMLLKIISKNYRKEFDIMELIEPNA